MPRDPQAAMKKIRFNYNTEDQEPFLLSQADVVGPIVLAIDSNVGHT